ncbi:uncharacterized protein TNCV_4215111 [Trichonephila clavipes]|nr:uncharacterized protein TNCV_4215111 [Trichonephila clavipes]
MLIETQLSATLVPQENISKLYDVFPKIQIIERKSEEEKARSVEQHVDFSQDNASVYIALPLKQFIADKCITVLEHPPYSPDLAPYDFCLFHKVKNVLLGTHFQCVGEVKFLPESVARVAAFVEDHRCHTPRHCFKETLDVFLGYGTTSSFHTLPKLIWCGSWGCNLGQPLSNYGPHVFYRRKIWRASRPGKRFNMVTDEEPLDNTCHVWSRIILLKYGCGQALKVRKDNSLQHLMDVVLAV